MRCGIGCRQGSDPALLWLWRRPVATAPALEKAKKAKSQKKNKQTKKTTKNKNWHCGVPTVAQQKQIQLVIQEDVGLIPHLAQWIRDPVLP